VGGGDARAKTGGGGAEKLMWAALLPVWGRNKVPGMKSINSSVLQYIYQLTDEYMIICS
jgi:hypothetical protein